MAKSRMVNTRFWVDEYTSNLDPIEKLLFLYFLTNPATDICGVYEIPLKTVAIDTGIEQETVKLILKRFRRDGKMVYKDGWVGIKNFIKHQSVNPKVLQGIEIGLNKAPIEILDSLSLSIDRLSHSNSNSNLNSNTKAKDATTVAYSESDLELASLLLTRIKNNTPTFKEPDLGKWADQVRLMRERDNRTPDQIRFLVEWCQGNDFWKANILSTKKLREKFDTLVAQASRKGNIKSGKGFA